MARVGSFNLPLTVYGQKTGLVHPANNVTGLAATDQAAMLVQMLSDDFAALLLAIRNSYRGTTTTP